MIPWLRSPLPLKVTWSPRSRPQLLGPVAAQVSVTGHKETAHVCVPASRVRGDCGPLYRKTTEQERNISLSLPDSGQMNVTLPRNASS